MAGRALGGVRAALQRRGGHARRSRRCAARGFLPSPPSPNMRPLHTRSCSPLALASSVPRALAEVGLYHAPPAPVGEVPGLQQWRRDPVRSRWIIGHPHPRCPAAWGGDASPGGRRRVKPGPTPGADATDVQTPRTPPHSTPAPPPPTPPLGSRAPAPALPEVCADGSCPHGPGSPSFSERTGFRREGGPEAHLGGWRGGWLLSPRGCYRAGAGRPPPRPSSPARA